MLPTTTQKPGNSPCGKSQSRPGIPISVSTPIFTQEMRRFKRNDLDFTIHIYNNELNSLVDDKTRDITRDDDVESRNILENRKLVVHKFIQRKSAAKPIENDDHNVKNLSSEMPNFVGIERQPIIQRYHSSANYIDTSNVGASLPVLNNSMKRTSSYQPLKRNNLFQASIPRASSLTYV